MADWIADVKGNGNLRDSTAADVVLPSAEFMAGKFDNLLFGAKEPDYLLSFSCARFLRHLPRTRASVGNHGFKARAKTRRHQKHSATWAALAFDGPLLLFTRFYFLFHLNLPLFNPCYFDEATSPGVTMTVSHTRGVTPNHDGLLMHRGWEWQGLPLPCSPHKNEPHSGKKVGVYKKEHLCYAA